MTAYVFCMCTRSLTSYVVASGQCLVRIHYEDITNSPWTYHATRPTDEQSKRTPIQEMEKELSHQRTCTSRPRLEVTSRPSESASLLLYSQASTPREMARGLGLIHVLENVGIEVEVCSKTRDRGVVGARFAREGCGGRLDAVAAWFSSNRY